MWRIQHTYGDEYHQIVARNRALRDIERNTEIFTPRRGYFVDRNMQPLTGTDPVFTVYLNVQALHDRYVVARRNSPDVDIREEIFNTISIKIAIIITNYCCFNS
jgi:hypothetical protein